MKSKQGAVRRGFSFAQHTVANELRSQGLWADLGSDFGHLQARFRPFTDAEVTLAREAEEERQRQVLGREPDDDTDLPSESSVAVSRASMAAATVGWRGTIEPDDRLRAVAEQFNLPLTTGADEEGSFEVLVLTGEETKAAVAALSEVLYSSGTALMLRALKRARYLSEKVTDKEVVTKAGKGFVYAASHEAA